MTNDAVSDAGQDAVAAKLRERGLVLRAGPDSRRSTHRIVVDESTGSAANLIVRTIRGKGGWQFDAENYMEIAFGAPTSTQRIAGLRTLDEPQTSVVFAWLAGESEPRTRFFILHEWMVQALAYRSHRLVLRRHGWTRPRKPESTHCALWAADMEWFEDDWDLIEEAVGRAPASRIS